MHSRLGTFGLAGDPSSFLSFTRIRPSTQKSLLYALRCMPESHIVRLQTLADVQHHSLSHLNFGFQAEAFHTAVQHLEGVGVLTGCSHKQAASGNVGLSARDRTSGSRLPLSFGIRLPFAIVLRLLM